MTVRRSVGKNLGCFSLARLPRGDRRSVVCRRLAQGAIRLAEGDGLLTIQEPRHREWKLDSDVVRSISRDWLAWLRRGGRWSCPTAWCSFLGATTITGLGRFDQAAKVGRLTRASSPIGAMLSSVM